MQSGMSTGGMNNSKLYNKNNNQTIWIVVSKARIFDYIVEDL